MIIRDELYGSIACSELEEKIIDSEEFQRLRRIKQMAFTYLVYPGATHTRFDHSLGTMHLAGRIAEKLALGKETVEKIRLFALLHDVGHVAFSHESEALLKDYLGDHEEIGKQKIASGELKDILGEHYRIDEITRLEDAVEGKIVTSDVGADRMDYLMRDARNTGVAYGIIEVDRIIETLVIDKNELVVREGGLNAVENLLIARYMMFSTVYLHHTVRIAAALLRTALYLAIKSNELKARELLYTGDEETLLRLRKIAPSAPYAHALLNRKLFKEVYSLSPHEKLRQNIRKAQEDLTKKLGVQIIIDYPAAFFKPVDFRVKIDGRLEPIIVLSDLVKTLEASEEKRRRVLVLSGPGVGVNKEEVRKLLDKYRS